MAGQNGMAKIFHGQMGHHDPILGSVSITSYCRTGRDAQRRCRRDDARCSANHTIATTAACIATR